MSLMMGQNFVDVAPKPAIIGHDDKNDRSFQSPFPYKATNIISGSNGPILGSL